jgi:signal transduction histidine kinase
VISHPYLRFLFFLPQAVLLGLLTWACLHFNFKLFGPPPGYTGDHNDWRALNRAYFLVYLLAVLPILLLGILNKAFLTAQTDVFPDQYLPAFLAGMSLAVLAFTALIPIKVQAISRAASEAGAARKTAESLTHIGELLRRMRHQRHDFHHQLQAVYGLLETECYQEARQHIRKTHAVISTSLELIRTDQPHVTALLYTKLVLAEAKQIRLEPVIECTLQNLPLDPLETCSLLGNLLDNAMEAVAEAPPAERVVRLEIKRDPGGYLITVANRGRLKTSPPARLFRAGYTTKEGHAGLGLAGVKEIVTRYGGTITVSDKGTETVFRVLLPSSNNRTESAGLPENQSVGIDVINMTKEGGNGCQSPY